MTVTNGAGIMQGYGTPFSTFQPITTSRIESYYDFIYSQAKELYIFPCPDKYPFL